MSNDNDSFARRIEAVEKEQIRQSMEQRRTNEILTEFRGDVKKAFGWVLSLCGTAMAGAILALILKHP